MLSSHICRYISYHRQGIYNEPDIVIQDEFDRFRFLRFDPCYQNHRHEILFIKFGNKELIRIDEADGRVNKIEFLE